MKISTKGRYGVTAMYELALHYGDGPISLKSIALKQGISEHYLEQLICTLRNNGFVKSVRGAQGGYMLAKEQTCAKAGLCVTRGIWAKVCDSITNVLDSITLADLCQEKK